MEPFKANYGTNTGIVTAPIQPAAEIQIQGNRTECMQEGEAITKHVKHVQLERHA